MSNLADLRHLVRLEVKLTGTDGSGGRFTQTAFTHDVSTRGARLTQVPPFLCPAEVVDVEYRRKRSRFRVVWVGGSANDEVGLLNLEPKRCIWGAPLPGRIIRGESSVPLCAAEAVMTKKRKRLGYFCKDPDCRKTHAFHLIAEGQFVWDIWPQKIECPVSGKRCEYWKQDIRSGGYV